MAMESDSASDTEETEKSIGDAAVNMVKISTTSGLSNDGGLPFSPKAKFLKFFENARTTASDAETASLESKIQGGSELNNQDEDKDKTNSTDAGTSSKNSEDVSSVSRTQNCRVDENGESSNAQKKTTDAGGDEPTCSKLRYSDKCSNALELSGHYRASNKRHTIFTKIPYITRQSNVMSTYKDMTEKYSYSISFPICQNKTENKRPSSTGEAFTSNSTEMEDNKKPQSKAQIDEPDLQEFSCKTGSSNQEQTFERRESFAICRPESSTALSFDRKSRSGGLNFSMKTPDIPKTLVDRGVQVYREHCGMSPTTLESKVCVLESRIRLEELRSRHWMKRVMSAEKSLSVLGEQLQALDQAMKTMSCSHVVPKETKSSQLKMLDNIPEENLAVNNSPSSTSVL